MQGNVASLRAIRAKADAHANNLRPVLESLAQEGIRSLGGIAAQLNGRGMLTPRGKRWHKSSVAAQAGSVPGLPDRDHPAGEEAMRS